MIYVAVACSVSFIICMYVDYRKLKNMFEDAQVKIDALDKKYLISEILNKPDSQESEMLFSVLKKAEISMSDNVADFRRGSEEYRDYIETWVHEVKIPISASRMIIENHGDETVEEATEKYYDLTEGNYTVKGGDSKEIPIVVKVAKQ